MKRIYRALVLTATAVAALSAAGPAAAEEKTETFRFPVTVQGYQVKQEMTLAEHPKVDGFITGMSTDVVDEDGKSVPIDRIMLHHIVFSKFGDANPQCDEFRAFDYDQKLPGLARPFYGAGEERNVLDLPPGYGLPTAASDRWINTWMLMNHKRKKDSVFIEWKVTYDTDPNIKPVNPYWLDVVNCNADPIYNVPGGGKPGSTHSRSYDFEMPESGHIVAAGGHVHGGGKNLEISQPGCGDRRLMRMDPAWGTADHPFYNVRPVLHEPGPIAVSAYFTSQGFPIAKGETLRLTSNYDNELPHTRVMGISLVYVAPSSEPVNPCAQLPSDVQRVQTTQPFRTKPPRFTVPIVGIGPNGNARDIKRPPGRTVRLKSGAKIGVRDYYFTRPNVKVKRGAKLNWRFRSKADVHNVTLASGPRGFGSPNRKSGRFSYRFRKKGKYRIFCALHPVAMTETVTVK